VFPDEETETMISFLPHFPLVYQVPQVAVQVGGSNLIVRPRTLDDECIERAETIALTILERLPETPLRGVGINFGFVEETPSAALVQLFDFGDNGDVSAAGWNIEERRLSRKLILNDETLNLTLLFDGSEVNIDFNFHTETNSNPTAQTAVTNRMLRLREAALTFLDSIYHLVPEAEEE